MEDGVDSGRLIRGLMPVCLLAIVLLAAGCIEHTYFYDFDLDGNCDFSYRARGDSLDIYEPPGSDPDSLFFAVSTWTEVDSSGTETYILEARRHLCPDSLPGTMSLQKTSPDGMLLQHPTSLQRIPLFFCTFFRFQQTFQGRKKTFFEGDQWAFIPEECRRLETENDTTLTDEERRILEEKYAAGMLLWNAQRYKMRLQETVELARERHPDTEIPQAWIDSALVEGDAFIDDYVATHKWDSLDFADLEWWADLKPNTDRILQENLNLLGDTIFQADLVHIGDMLELRHQVTEDLLDDTFVVRVKLPGFLLSSNTESNEEGVFVWEFEGDGLTDDDFELKAVSVHIFFARVIGTLVLILVVLLGIQFKRPRPQKENSPEQTIPHSSVPPTGHG